MNVRTPRPPESWRRIADRFPDVAFAYDALSAACRGTGPLDEQVVALVKLAVSVGAGCQRTVHAHARKAVAGGLDPDALRQVALIALPTIGLPAALDALKWIDESVSETPARRRRGPRPLPESRQSIGLR